MCICACSTSTKYRQQEDTADKNKKNTYASDAEKAVRCNEIYMLDLKWSERMKKKNSSQCWLVSGWYIKCIKKYTQSYDME